MTHEDCRPISQDVLAVIFYNQPILDKQKKMYRFTDTFQHTFNDFWYICRNLNTFILLSLYTGNYYYSNY